MNINLLLICLFLSLNISAQSIHEDMAALSGNWTGTLSYLDYSDDESQSTLNCTMKVEWKDKRGKLFIGFEEPNGKIYYDKSSIRIIGSGDSIQFDGHKYTIKHFNKDNGTGFWTLIVERSGKDNRKSSTIRQSFMYQGDKISLVKEVKYNDIKDYFVRNSYVLRRGK